MNLKDRECKSKDPARSCFRAKTPRIRLEVAARMAAGIAVRKHLGEERKVTRLRVGRGSLE